MGLLSKLFSRDDDSPVVSRAVDREACRAQLTELADALDELRSAMRAPGSPQNNPGWDGRVRDFTQASNGARMLCDRPVITHDELYDHLSTVRPLFRGNPPAEFSHLVVQNQRVSIALDTLVLG